MAWYKKTKEKREEKTTDGRKPELTKGKLICLSNDGSFRIYIVWALPDVDVMKLINKC